MPSTRPTSACVRPAQRLLRLAWMAALVGGITALGSTRIRSQDLVETVEFDTFFSDEPAWIFGIRPAIGYDHEEEWFPQIGVVLGHVSWEHLYFGGHLGFRLTTPVHLRTGLRSGVFFRSSNASFGTGVSMGFVAIPDRHLFGLVPTWGFEGRLRLKGNHYMTLFVEADLLFDSFGFEETDAILSGGLGWSMTF